MEMLVGNMDSSARLRSWRKRQGYTQAKLAELLGVSRSFLGDIESGRTEVSRNLLTLLSERLGLRADWVLHGQGEPSSDDVTHVSQPSYGESSDTLGQVLNYQFGELVGACAATPEDRLNPIWHEALELPGDVPISLDRSWFINFNGNDDRLRAVPIVRSTVEAPLSGRMIALVDPAASQEGGPAKWALIADDMTQLAEVEFHRHAMVLHRFRTDRSSITLWYDERQAIELLGRVVWLGIDVGADP
jgi:transcriptional regulator with XRE-family HTH domain